MNGVELYGPSFSMTNLVRALSVAPGAVADEGIADNAGIQQAKIAGLVTVLATTTATLATIPFERVSSHAAAGENRVQAAIDALPSTGGVVLIDYQGVLTIPPLVPKPNVTLRGLGELVTGLKLKAGANAPVVGNLAAGGCSGLVVEDLTIDGNGVNQTAASQGIVTVASTGTVVRRTKIVNTYASGIFHFLGGDHAISENTLSNIGTNETETGGTHSAIVLQLLTGPAKVHHNTIDTPWDHGIALFGTGNTGITIDHNTISGCGRTTHGGSTGGIGIALGGLNHGITVSDNTVSGCTGNGIDFGSCYQLTISTNTVTNCNGGIIGDTALLTAGQVLGITISSNTVTTTTNFLGSSAYGIAMGGSVRTTDCTVTGNITTNTAAVGIVVQNIDNGTVTGNVAKNAGSVLADGHSGIRIASSTGMTVTGNRAYDDRPTKAQAYGIEEYGASNRNLFVGNVIHGNAIAAKVVVGANSLAANNIES